MSTKKDAIKIPPVVKGFFTWNENSFGLDFVQTSPGKVVHPLMDPLHSTDTTNRRNHPTNGIIQSGRTRGARKESTIISLADVKAVGISILVTDRLQQGYHHLSKEFERVTITPSFESLMIYILRYFECFFTRSDLKERIAATTFLHPSKAEIKQTEDTRIKLEKSRNTVAQQYCALVLGIGMSDMHHMGCGQKRNSQSQKDKILFEEIYSFFTFFVWVAFGRRNYKLIFTEVGALLRSETFNPANQRIYQKHFSQVQTPSKKAETETETETETKTEEKKPDVFRLPKRPPITSIINQRSTVLTSLLPNSKQRSSHLYSNLSQNSSMQFKSSSKQDDMEPFSLHERPVIQPGEKLGIIGDSFELYNRKDLTLKECEDDENCAKSEQIEGLLLDSPSKIRVSAKVQQNNRGKTFSRVTTAEGRTYSSK